MRQTTVQRLRRYHNLFDNETERGTPDGDFLEVMITLIEAYETQHFPVELPDPIEAITFRME